MRGVHLLNVLYLANQARQDPLPDSEFYNKSVCQQADLAYEYIVWHRMQVRPLQLWCTPTYHPVQQRNQHNLLCTRYWNVQLPRDASQSMTCLHEPMICGWL